MKSRNSKWRLSVSGALKLIASTNVVLNQENKWNIYLLICIVIGSKLRTASASFIHSLGRTDMQVTFG